MVLPEHDAGMKTAISLPDELFSSADALAQRLGVSRSELYTQAVAEYVAKHRNEDVTARLNQVYALGAQGVDPAMSRAQARGLGMEVW